jgi:hypothetical protein
MVVDNDYDAFYNFAVNRKNDDDDSSDVSTSMLTVFNQWKGRVSAQRSADVRGLLFADLEGEYGGSLAQMSLGAFDEDSEVRLGCPKCLCAPTPGSIPASPPPAPRL